MSALANWKILLEVERAIQNIRYTNTNKKEVKRNVTSIDSLSGIDNLHAAGRK